MGVELQQAVVSPFEGVGRLCLVVEQVVYLEADDGLLPFADGAAYEAFGVEAGLRVGRCDGQVVLAAEQLHAGLHGEVKG